MATSVFSVDVSDESFRKFKALFDQYSTNLDKMPKAWRAINKEIGAGTGAADKLNEAFGKTNARIGSLRSNTRAWSSDLQRSERSLTSMAMWTGKIASNIASAAYGFARATGMVTLASGLLGAGGLWGISNLASGAANTRRTTQGLNLAPGELQAYRTNFQRFADPGSVLSNIASARNDPASQWAFSAMGVPDWQSRSVSDLATTLPLMAKRIYAEGGQNTQYAEARGLTQFFSVEDLRRLHEMTEAEIVAAGRRFDIDRRQMAVSDDVARKWQNFSVQLERSGTAIETSFIRALGPLAPELEKLSIAFQDAVTTILSTERIKEVVDTLATGIREGAAYLISDKFKDDVREFGQGLSDMWNAAKRFAAWINKLMPAETTFRSWGVRGDELWTSHGGLGGALFHGTYEREAYRAGALSIHRRPTADQIGQLGGVPGIDLRAGVDPHSWLRGPTVSPSSFADHESRYNLPAGTLDSIWNIESGRGQNMVGPLTRSGERAMGHFQFMPRTGAQYGLRNPADFNDLQRSSEAAARYLGDLAAQFRGDMRMAVAAYNAGPGTVSDLIRDRGANWEGGLPRETQAYLARMANVLPPRVDIRIDNRVGAQISVQQAGTPAQ
jgi:hypothetical protein